MRELEIIDNAIKQLKGKSENNIQDSDKLKKISEVLNDLSLTEDYIKKNVSLLNAHYKLRKKKDREQFTALIKHYFEIEDELQANRILNIILYGVVNLDEDDEIAIQIHASHGMDDADSDININTDVEYAFHPENPILLNGIDKITLFFSNLHLITGERTSAIRIPPGFKVDRFTFLVDKYQIFNSEEEKLDIVYVYAYSNTSNPPAPKGYKLKHE